MDLAAELAAFDGKHNVVLEALAARLAPEPAVIRELIKLAARDDAKLQTAATWLLKRFHEDGHGFTTEQIAGLLNLFETVTHWEARLHLLQMLPGLAVPEARKDALFRLLKGAGFLHDPNKFVRAWSYNALAVMAEQFPALRATVAPLLAAGQEDEAASVRARLRRVVKEHGWAGE